MDGSPKASRTDPGSASPESVGFQRLGPKGTGSGKVAVLVLGMHRSGTSVVAGLVNALGCCNPRTLLPASEYNPKGYFESEPVFRLNDEILTAAGSHWSDWRPLAPAWWTSPRFTEFRQRARVLLEQEYGEATLIGLKDPRLCRLLPLWRAVLEDAGFDVVGLHVNRHPVEVATSLERRVNIAVQRGVGQLAWLRYVLDAEEHSRDLPRVFVDYDDVLRDWQRLRERTEQVFGPIWPTTSAAVERRIEDLIDPSLRHHGGDARRLSSSLSDDLRICFEVLHDWAQNDETADGRAALDAVRAGFDRAARLFSGTLAIADRSAQEIGALRQALEQERRAAEVGKAEAEAARASLEVRTGELQACVTALEAAQQEVKAGLAERDRRLALLGAEIDEHVMRVVERDRIVSTVRRDFDRLRREAAEMEAELRSQLDRALSRLADRESKVSELRLSAVRERERTSEDLAKLRARAEANRASQAAAHANAVAEIHDMYRGSTSWRLSAPIRLASRVVKQTGPSTAEVRPAPDRISAPPNLSAGIEQQSGGPNGKSS